MYLADLLNSRGLFQRTSTWMSTEGLSDDISFLLSRGTSAVVSILRIEQAQNNCIREFELFDDQLVDLESRIVFNSQSLVELQNEISPLLSCLRILQDSTISLIGKTLKTSLPSSIDDTIKKIDKFKLPNEIKNILLKYWNSGGSKIRDYRILDQHYTSISDYVFLQLKPEKKILLLFPDNPYEKSKKNFRYEQEICGISALRIGFDDLHEMIESVAEYFGYEPSQIQTSVSMRQLGDLQPFRNRLLGFIFESPIIKQPDGTMKRNISSIRVSQKEDGRLSLQKMYLTENKLKDLLS
ncbi:MAG: hypothetical protein CVU44_00795 [Chloroflexi bacterium HGW-Chloroflexi-6]|nr:MAG: hypothetical protein CVU44_00795 [Chloroflexi bacterium HGW-Chloroflexi-6]